MSAGPAPASAQPPDAAEASQQGPATKKVDDDTVELKEILGSQASLPVEEDIMQLARLGELGAIQKLFDKGKYDATYKDDQGITPLHWAAINNHYALCHYLIQVGAEINARGGDAVATPVLWAAKRCNYYIVNLLLQNGADPLLTDDQGFNLLHSATLDGNVFQLVLLLHLDIPVDIPDAQGHTSLMWAAYKGYPACVNLFLRWGADVYAKDDLGFTALHWALVNGSSVPAIAKLIEHGSDRYAENNEGKTPAITAQEMNSEAAWHRALSNCGYTSDGQPKYFLLASYVKDRRKLISRFLFLWPFVILFCVLSILSHMVFYAAVPIAAFVGYCLHWVAQSSLAWAPPDMKQMYKTPFLAGIFAGSLFWVGIRWVFVVLPWTIRSHVLLNLFFALCFTSCTYFYFLSMMNDPGYVPKAPSRTKQKAVVEELLEARRFDEANFCVHCMVRKPLRSKHCRRCARCVSKVDHHCPWVDNCVANDNHRHFILYIISLEAGVLVFLNLVFAYLDIVPLPAPQLRTCNILAEGLCEVLNKDPFTVVVALWAAIQLIWVTMLIAVQLLQVARAITTYESMKGHIHNNNHSSPSDMLTSFVATGSTSAEGGQLDGTAPSDTDPTSTTASMPRRRQRETFCQQWRKLLGLDTFVATARHTTSQSHAQRAQQAQANPFNRGYVTNCRDFWCDPAPIFGQRGNGEAVLGGERVYYASMYEAPMRMRMRAARGVAAGRGDYVAVAGEGEDVV